MWTKRVVSSLLVLVVGICGIRGTYAGPEHEEALAIVKEGEAISDTGDLDAAMAKYDKVERLYPEEYEAILWARYRKSEALGAGGRWKEAEKTTRWIWEQIEAGRIENPEARFWGGSQHAKCLEKEGGGWRLAQVASRVVELAEDLPERTKGVVNALGWLHYWLGREYRAKEQYTWAGNEAEEAWELGEREGNETLKSWARLLMADALRGEGNLILSWEILLECREQYRPSEGSLYDMYLRKSETEAKLSLGVSEEVREEVVRMLEEELGEPQFRIQAALLYVDHALKQGATMELLGPLAMIRNSLNHIPLWGDQAEERWQRIRGTVSGEAFAAALSERDGEGTESELERQALRIQLAEELVGMGLGEEALGLCDAVEGACGDPRYAGSLRILRAEAAESTREGEVLRTVEGLLEKSAGDAARARELVERAREEIERGGSLDYGVWLESQRESLPVGVYCVEKARWLRGPGGDPAGALELAERALEEKGTDFEAGLEKTIALYRVGEDEKAEAEVQAFLEGTVDAGRRNYGLFRIADALRDHEGEVAQGLLDRVIGEGERDLWWQECMMDKGYLLLREGRTEEAKEFLELLVAEPPLAGNGGESIAVGKVLLAKLHAEKLGDSEKARELFREVVESGEEIRFGVDYACREYVNLLRREKDWEGTEAACEAGLRKLPRTRKESRGLLRLWKSDAKHRQGKTAEAVAEVEAMLGEGLPEKVRAEALDWLSSASEIEE